MSTTSVLFVCLGNICRSPTAEGIFRHQVHLATLSDQIVIDSAGTGNWHVGNPPDSRARAAATRRGYNIDQLKARQIEVEDFSRFEHIIAMDLSNLSDLRDIASGSPGATGAEQIRLMLSFSDTTNQEEVPDPYFGGENGFNHVIDLLESACAGLLASIRKDR